ncbi:MAG: hypothetical protein OXU41_05505 [Gammaproteobacteria bacterium]|nr:hypothetical protein [Gammaproteobacteria bacterium]MDD9870966.1 hypothetical protein [Gammaproteobacteria bacterium]
MLILALGNAIHHDSAAVIAEDYEILAAVQTERLTRIKGDGQGAHAPTIAEALRVAGAKLRDVDVLAASTNAIDVKYFSPWPWRRSVNNAVAKMRGAPRIAAARWHGADYRESAYSAKFNPAQYMADIGLRPGAQFFSYEHHLAHALSALFFTGYDNALAYTADGGGDNTFYSACHLRGRKLRTLHGGSTESFVPGGEPVDSIGMAYADMTTALGYRRNRHEGKLTGLAAYGEPSLAEELKSHFRIIEDGRIHADFKSNEEMQDLIFRLAKTTTPQNAAASIQKLTEDILLQSIGVYLRRTGARQVALAGGVFANVLLNQRIAESPGVEDVFIFPGMGDEGLAVGGLLQFLLERDGLPAWLSRRRRLENVYWGGAFDGELPHVFDAPGIARVEGEGGVADTAAELLRRGKIVALFCGRMEFGPRALGARSILASPADKSVNDTLNKRLGRTEFMPFAPFVLEEDADDVFHLAGAARYAAKFMTITCKVRGKWREKIPAVVHLDGTARPQILSESQNPLYADILRRFKQKTGLPALINTSFNAHEEPLIHTPAECLRALRAGRVDYVAGESGVFAAEAVIRGAVK